MIYQHLIGTATYQHMWPHVCLTTVLVPCQQFAQKVKKLICHCATINDEAVVLLDLSLAINILQVEKKPLLSLLSIESLPGSEESGGDQQMTTEFLNETFSVKSTQYVQSK